MKETPITLVVTRDPRHAVWRRQGTILVPNFGLLEGALMSGVSEHGKEITRVILDRVVDSATYLDLLAKLPMEFRGDVLWVANDGSGFLSAVSRRDDGRHLYRLTPSDIAFYRDAAMGMPEIGQRPVLSEESLARATG